ncbi:MAG: sigma-70 family RNA polymerase sigma factor [Armatimonadota bacterium]
MYTDDSFLVNAVLLGDKDGYGKLVDKYKKMVYGIAWSNLGDVDLSEDAAQETFVKAYTYLGTLREPGKFAGWLARIARNVCGSLGRGIKRENAFHNRLAVLESAEAGPQEEDRESLSQQLWDSFAKLPVIHREALTLFYVEGKSIAEASSALGIAEQTMRTRLHRARTALRTQLEHMLEESLSDMQPSRGFTRSVIVLLPLTPKGATGVGLLAVLGKLSASISFMLWTVAVSALPLWVFYSLFSRLEESSLEDAPQNQTARAMIRRVYRKAAFKTFATVTAFFVLNRFVGPMTAVRIEAVVIGCMFLLVIIGVSPQLLGRIRIPGATSRILMYGVIFAAIVAAAFFDAPDVTGAVAFIVIGIISYFTDPQMPPMWAVSSYNPFSRIAGLPEIDMRLSRKLSKLDLRTFARLLAEMRQVRDYRFEGDTVCLSLFSMSRNPLETIGIVPSRTQMTIGTDGVCTTTISNADLAEQACHTIRYALSLFAEGRIQDVRDIFFLSPDRSSPRVAISIRNHRIIALINIWFGIMFMVDQWAARSKTQQAIIHIPGLVIPLIALAITLYINKRQMSSTQH